MNKEQQQLPEQYNDDITNEFGGEQYDADIDSGVSPVAAGKSSKIIAIMILSALIIGVLMFAFSGDDEEELKEEAAKVEVYETNTQEEGPEITYNVSPQPEEELEPLFDTISPEEEVISDVVTLDVPELPDLEVPDLPDSDDFNISPTFGDDDIFSQIEQNDSKTNNIITDKKDTGDIVEADIDTTPVVRPLEERGPMLVMDGGDLSIASERDAVAVTDSSTVSATRIEFPERTIAQGKLIDSVLETAINTDLEGKVRAVVSRDVYADFGKTVFIPKGSRLVGEYSGSTSRGQTRVLITWNRVIRPDAIDIMIDSPASDQFGRSGVPGDVDNKYLELFNNSILLSLITVGTAMAIESSTNTDGITETTNPNGQTQTVAQPSDLAAQEVIDGISDTAKTVLDGVLDVSPTITIPHGTRIKVFVNHDLVFPEGITASDQNGVVFLK